MTHQEILQTCNTLSASDRAQRVIQITQQVVNNDAACGAVSGVILGMLIGCVILAIVSQPRGKK